MYLYRYRKQAHIQHTCTCVYMCVRLHVDVHVYVDVHAYMYMYACVSINNWCHVCVVAEFNKQLTNELKKQIRNRRRRARNRRAAQDMVTLGSRTTTTESGQGHCGRSGSESDIREYELWVHRDRGDFDVSPGYVQYKSIR